MSLISTVEAAKLLHISSVSVWRACRDGRIKAQYIGHSYVMESDDLPVVWPWYKRRAIDKVGDGGL